jgi:hypothetical protein
MVEPHVWSRPPRAEVVMADVPPSGLVGLGVDFSGDEVLEVEHVVCGTFGDS